MPKFKKDLKDAALGDMIEEKYHCSNPSGRYTKVYLIIAENNNIWHGRNSFVCIDVGTGKEVVKDFTRPVKNLTYKFVG